MELAPGSSRNFPAPSKEPVTTRGRWLASPVAFTIRTESKAVTFQQTGCGVAGSMRKAIACPRRAALHGLAGWPWKSALMYPGGSDGEAGGRVSPCAGGWVEVGGWLANATGLRPPLDEQLGTVTATMHVHATVAASRNRFMHTPAYRRTINA